MFLNYNSTYCIEIKKDQLCGSDTKLLIIIPSRWSGFKQRNEVRRTYLKDAASF